MRWVMNLRCFPKQLDTAVQRRSVTRMVLPAAGRGSVVTLSPVVACPVHCYCCCCRWVIISPQKKTKIVCAMKIKKRFTETPGNRLIHSRKKKNFGRPPRELQCSDRAQTSTTGSGQPSCIDVVLGFWLKVLVRRDKFENRRKNHNYTYTYDTSIVISVL